MGNSQNNALWNRSNTTDNLPSRDPQYKFRNISHFIVVKNRKNNSFDRIQMAYRTKIVSKFSISAYFFSKSIDCSTVCLVSASPEKPTIIIKNLLVPTVKEVRTESLVGEPNAEIKSRKTGRNSIFISPRPIAS